MNKYCKTTTLSLQIAKKNEDCIQLINDIIKKESFHEETQETRCDFEKN